MANKELGIADPVYDALRIRSGQSIAPDLGGGTTGGSGLENKIYVWHADGSTIDTFDPDAAGLALALAAAAAGDLVWCPQVTIACTAGITIPASVTLQHALLSFSGFSGTGVTLSSGSVLLDATITMTGAGATARGVLASGIGCSINRCNITATGATSNTGIELSGVSASVGVNTTNVYTTAIGGTTAIGARVGDYVHAKSTYADADAATNNIGVSFFATSAAAAANWDLDGWGFSQVAGSIGMKIEDSKYGRIIGGFAVGIAAGLLIGTGATALVYGLQWSSLVNNGTLTYLPGDRSTASGSGGSNWFNVEDYGADPAASAADNTTAINAAIAAIPADGGVLFFPRTYNTTGGFTLNKPITVLGNGSNRTTVGVSPVSAPPISTIYSNSATNSLFTVSSGGCSFYNIALVNNAAGTPSSGAGITVSADAEGAHYNGIMIWGFYDDLYINDGALWSIVGSTFYYPVRYGLYAAHADSTDYGDWSIVNCVFASYQRNPTAAIHIASGGGGKISNIKVNGAGPDYGFTYGIEASIAGVQTGVLLISNNSIENFHGDGIHITTSGTTPAYSLINVVGNEFGSYLSNSGGRAIYISAANLGEIDQVIIDANLFRAATGATAMSYAISLTKIDNVYIGTYTINANWTDLLTQSGCTNVKQIGLGSGTVTSVTAGTGLTATPNPIVASGTIALDAALNQLNDVDTTGTGTGDVIYNSGSGWIDYPLGLGSKITVSGTKIRFGNVSGGNYLEIDSVTGTLRLVGDSTVWDDFRVEASVIKPGATAPNWKAFGPSGNLQALMFEASHHDEAYFEIQMPHDWLLGSNIYPHVHWTPVNTTAGNVVWELEYSWADVGDAFGAPGNMATDATAAGGTAWVHKLTDFKEGGNNYIDGTGKTLSSMLVCRIHRNSNSGSDTLNQDVALLEVDFHYQIDSLGSDERLVKDASASLLLETGDILLLETGDRLLME